jgi:ubiquinone/menaquinone biosynthesis C-methylase UbiE
MSKPILTVGVITSIALCWMITAAPSLDEQPREIWQPPDKIMDAIGVKPGMKIGEAGAGRGYMTFPLAERVGADGIVYANDISRSSLQVINNRAGQEGITSITTVVGEVEDPLFPEKDLDMVIMVYVLHCLERPMQFLDNVKQYLKPDASLVIIERDTDHERAHYPSFMTRREILETIGKTSFVLQRTETFLPKDTIYIFQLRE